MSVWYLRFHIKFQLKIYIVLLYIKIYIVLLVYFNIIIHFELDNGIVQQIQDIL